MATIYLVLGENRQKDLYRQTISNAFFRDSIANILTEQVVKNNRRVSMLLEGSFSDILEYCPNIAVFRQHVLRRSEVSENENFRRTLDLGIEPSESIRIRYDLGFFDTVLDLNDRFLCPIECSLEPQSLRATVKSYIALKARKRIDGVLESDAFNREAKAIGLMKIHITNLCQGLMEQDMMTLKAIRAQIAANPDIQIILPRDRRSRYMKNDMKSAFSEAGVVLNILEDKNAHLDEAGSFIPVAIAAHYAGGVSEERLEALARLEVERLMGHRPRRNAPSTISY